MREGRKEKRKKVENFGRRRERKREKAGTVWSNLGKNRGAMNE